MAYGLSLIHISTQLNQCGLNATKLAEDKYGDLKVFMTQNDDGTWSLGLPSDRYMVVNSTGSVSKSNSKIKAVSYTHLDVYKRQKRGNLSYRSFLVGVSGGKNT